MLCVQQTAPNKLPLVGLIKLFVLYCIVLMSFFFCRRGRIDGEAVYCETVVDEDVIRESVYLPGLVIAYNPSGYLNKGSLLFNF